MLAKLGHEVILVNGPDGVSESCVEEGVKVEPHMWFFNQVNYLCDVVVMCSATSKRHFEALEKNFIYALSICWQGHYGVEPALYESETLLYHVDLFAFVSEYQRNHFCRAYHCPIEKTVLMLNGASPPFHNAVRAKQDTFIYCSNPQRGLQEVPAIWKEIVKEHPTAKLEIFSSEKTYGKQSDSEFTLNIYKELRNLKNVTVFESVGQQLLAEHCGRAAFLLYPTHFVETSCIVCIETSCTGALPIVSDLGVFPEYVDKCVHYDNNVTTAFATRANELLNMFYNNRDLYNNLSETLSQKMSTKHNYTTLSKTFADFCEKIIITKRGSIMRLNDIETVFSNKAHNLCVYVGESFPLFFENKMTAALYFLRHGNHLMQSTYHRASEHYFLQSYNIVPSIASANNLTMYYEKVEKYDKMFEWYIKSLKFKFDQLLATKVIKYLDKLELFDIVSFLTNCQLLLQYTRDIDEFLFYCDCVNSLALRYRLVMNQEKAIESLRKLYKQIIDFPCDISKKRTIMKCISTNILFTSNYLKKEAQYFQDCLNYEKYIPTLYTPIEMSAVPNKKIRVGFISGDFMNHPVTYILNGFIANINTDEFEVFTFNERDKTRDNPDEFDYTKRYVQNIDMHSHSVEKCVELIRNRNIDVLVDMCGHTSFSAIKLMDVLRAKPAKVICSYFAYPNTTGIKAIDYKLGDETTLPLDSKHLYTEDFQFIKSGLHCYKPFNDKASIKKHHEGIVYGIFNNPQKLTYEFLETVAEILKLTPSSKLLFAYRFFELKGVQEFYKITLKSLGINSDRILFRFYNKPSELQTAYDDIDVTLDTFPYNGGTISIESLHYNTPYITLLGGDYVSRVGASILKQVNHPELIAITKEDYINKAISLSKNAVRLAGYHSNLRNDLKASTLEDGAKFAGEFECAVKEMLVKKGFQLPADKKSRRIVTIDGSKLLPNVSSVKHLALSREKAGFLLKRVGAVINNDTPLTTMLQFLTHQKLWESTLLDADVDLLEVCEGDLRKSSNIETDSCVILSKNPLHYLISTKYLVTLLSQSSPDVILTLESIQEAKKKTMCEILRMMPETSEPTLTIQSVVKPAQSSKKYMLCLPAGGICDMIFVISHCLEYAIANNRILIIDSSKVEWFKESIHDFIEFKHPSIYVGNTQSILKDLNTKTVYPADLKGHVSDFKIYPHTSKKYYATANKNSLLIDLTKSYSEDIIVYCLWATKRFTDEPNRFDITPFMKFKNNVTSVFHERRKLLPDSYVSFHIRNTDYKSDVPKFLEDHDEVFRSNACFLASDNKQNIDDIKGKYGNNIYTFSKIAKHNVGEGLHYLNRSREELISFIIDSYVDLLLLASGDKIYISNRHSGFSLYAERLMKDKKLLCNITQSVAEATDKIKAYCINLDTHMNNFDAIEKEFSDILKIERVSAVNGKQCGIPGAVALYKTTVDLFKRILTEVKTPFVIIIEDDIRRTKFFDVLWNQVQEFIQDSTKIWDFVSLDFFLNFDNPVIEDYNKLFYKTSSSRAAGFMIYNMKFLRDNIEYLSTVNKPLDMTMTYNKNFLKLIPKHLMIRQIVDKTSSTCDLQTAFYNQYYVATEKILEDKKIGIMPLILPKIVYINLAPRPDRRYQIETELKKFNLKAERFEAIVAIPGSVGCSLSHIAVLKQAIAGNWESVLILEDDFMFTVNQRELEEKLQHFNSSVKSYDVLLLSCYLIQSAPCDNVLLRVKEAQTRSGYLVHKRFFKTLLANFEEGVEQLAKGAPYTKYALDQYWKPLQKTYEWYCFRNRVGIQREGYSDIENKIVNYGV